MPDHRIGTRDDWAAARDELLARDAGPREGHSTWPARGSWR
jgi:hypothetical protein